ncbi:glycosyltransferase family 2 protein [Neptunitalea lumnitzerae]|uniref:Glycosyl transferase n=1 Tax=Neptunitalea lumnitzerae TaxID=2965509 RepID=A0ABQ5MN70_9FLAO|nr:glycosyltransferase family A protein [Neptunitalea sp. Y10]GLB50848.1 glycosyl transferase [Neptunitalea sp. Y10]
MIIVYHLHTAVTTIAYKDGAINGYSGKSIVQTLKSVASQFPEELVVWCSEKVKDVLDVDNISNLVHHNSMFVSYQPNGNYLGSKIGYVDESPFINVNKEVVYPTWQMSSLVGATSASVLNQIDDAFYQEHDFDYFLNSVAKTYMPLGLLCYSEPKLLKEAVSVSSTFASHKTLFRFVKTHYKNVWIGFLLLNTFMYEKQFLLFSFLNALFVSKPGHKNLKLSVSVASSKSIITNKTIDVIIPTLGRKKYLYDVLLDLKKQTHLPKKVIIVEQNPLPDSVSDLDYITKEEWPFEIDHTFTHVTGACNARNLALSKVTSEWVFLNDDDNRFEANLLEEAFNRIKQYSTKVLMASYVKPHEEKVYQVNFQAPFFGSGNSFMKCELLKKVKFNKALEFGYGEDTEFGLQLRNIGEDAIYFADLDIIHLNAPSGGFRTKFVHEWDADQLQPKPSPTVMYVRKKYSTQEQLNSYKTTLLLKYYKDQSIKNVITYYKTFQKMWERSIFWAQQLDKRNEV